MSEDLIERLQAAKEAALLYSPKLQGLADSFQEAIDAIAEKDREIQQAMRYTEQLIYSRWPQLKLLDDIYGRLMQIDNGFVVGLHRAEAEIASIHGAEADNKRLRQDIKDAVMLLRRVLNAGLTKPLTTGLRKLTLDWIERKGYSGTPLREEPKQ